MKNNYLDNLGNLLQVFSFMILLNDYNNQDLMRELQNQDDNYFKRIIKQNDEIIKLLKERK